MSAARRNETLVVLARILVDVCWIAAAYAIAVALTLPGDRSWSAHAYAHVAYLTAFLLVWCVASLDQGLFVSRRSEALAAVLFSVVQVFFTSLLFGAFLLALFVRGGVDRVFFVTFGVIAFAAVLAVTFVMRPSVWNLRRRGYGVRRILVIGANPRTVHLVEVLLANEHYGFQIVGFLEDDPARRGLLERFEIPCLGAIADLERILVERVIDGVYISLPVGSFYETVKDIAYLCEGVGVPVRLLADLFPLRIATSDVERRGDVPLLSLASEPELVTRFVLKRCFDLLASLMLLAALSPVLLIIAVLIRLDSRGPIFALQDRLGQGLRPFKMITFRLGRANGGGFTRVGTFLRRYGLDELPQVFNVLLGQMSLGGVRPLAPMQGEQKEEETEKRGDGQTEKRGDGQTGRRGRGTSLAVLAGLAILDVCCIMAAYGAAVAWTAAAPTVVPYMLVNYLPYLLVFVLVWAGAAIDRRLWSAHPREGAAAYLSTVAKAVANAAVFCVFFMVLFMPEGLPRRFLVAFCFGTLMLLLALHVVVRLTLAELWRLGYNLRRAVIIGANERTKHLLDVIGRPARYGCRVEGILDDDPERVKDQESFGVPYLGARDALAQALADRNVDEVYICLPVRSFYQAVKEITQRCESAGVAVHLMMDLFPLKIAASRVMLFEDLPFLSLSPISEAHVKLAVKRLIDFVGSTVLLICLSPMLLALAVLIKMDSRGPLLFGQERVGQNQRRFKMLKFRSMVANAEELRAKLEHLNELDGPAFKIRNDPRITRVGKYIRKFSLDEFPQLFNVWRGEMSLVGPRPPIPSEVAEYSWSQRRRLSVRPGMTGLWQVSGRSDVTFEEWVEMDLAYIDNWSLAWDFIILLKTFKAVTGGRGAA